MNESPLIEKLIEAPLIISRFVKGDERCNYELYITEALNASNHFRQRFAAPLLHSEIESHGECDAYTGSYGLDYKLIASKTALQARSIHSLQTQILMEGVYSRVACKTPGTMKVTRLSQALRGKSLDELLVIRNCTGKKQGIDNDVKEYMLTIETGKNLLMFFPYRFSFETPGILEEDCRTIADAIDHDHRISLQYRSSLCPRLDTYIVFLYDYYFVLCRWNGKNVDFLECIPVEESDTFMHLALTYCEDWNEKYDIVLQELRKQKEQQ